MEKQQFDAVKVAFEPYDYGTLLDVTWHPYPATKEYHNESGKNGWIEGTISEGYTVSRLGQCVQRTAWEAGSRRRFDFTPITSLEQREDGPPCFRSSNCG